MIDLPRIRNLYVLNAIYRHHRIGTAAEAENLSQPAATQALARIEDHLGASLFTRQPKGMQPTEPGRIFERRLPRILAHLSRGDDLARRKASRGHGQRHRTFHRFCSPTHLRALLAVAQAGSFNQAARDLGVSQPGIHRATRELAALSGLTLFDQTRGGVTLSSAAEAFLHHLRLAMSEFQQAVFEINEHLGKERTRIHVGSLPLSRVSILPAAIDEILAREGQNVQINCVDARYQTLLRDLRFGTLDFLIGALRDPVPANDVVQEKLFVDDLVVVAAPDHPLTRKPGLVLEDTLDYPWVAPPRDTPSGTYLFETLRIQDLPKSPVRVVSSSSALLRGMLARGEYVFIASRRQIEMDQRDNKLAVLPLDLPGSARAIGLTFRKGWVPTPMQDRFLNILREKAQLTAPAPAERHAAKPRSRAGTPD